MSSTADSLPLTFGGGWTRMKLDTIERHLDAYSTALKKTPFKLLYIDALAGTGQVHISTVAEEARALLRGSAERAMSALQRLTRNWRGRRGVLFLDPFATELEWAAVRSACGAGGSRADSGYCGGYT